MNHVTLYFTRLFIKGTLKGLTHNDQINFISVERAMDWVKGIKANSMKGKLDYKLCDYSFQKYWRH